MAHDPASAGSAPRPKQARRVAAVGAHAEQIGQLQDLGEALDALVRAVQQRDVRVEGLARRIQKAWLAQAELRVEWHGTELKSAGRSVLVAGTDSGRFIVPGHQAGLRALSARRDTSVEQIVALGERLCALERAALSPRALGRAMWRGELFGFDVVQVESLFELGESLVRDVSPTELWADCFRRTVEVWTELSSRAPAAGPPAARAERYGACVERFVSRATGGELELTDADVVALVQTADDGGGWASLEVGLLLQSESLRRAIARDQLCAVLSAYVQHAPRIDEALLSVLAVMGLHLRGGPDSGSAPPFPATRLGPAFALRLLTSAELTAETLSVLDGLDHALRGVILAGVCQHGDQHTHGPAVLYGLVRRYGMTDLLQLLDPSQLGTAMASAVVRAALQAGVEPATLLKTVERMEIASALSALAAGPGLCPLAVPMIAHMVARESSAMRLLPALVRSGQPGAAAVGAGLLSALTSGADPHEPDECLVALVTAGLGREVVLAVWQRRSLRARARISALLALQGDPRIFADAMRWTDPGIEPAEIRELLEELRWQEPG